jgi:hypothetical protein
MTQEQFEVIKVEDLTKKIALKLKEKGAFEWVQNNWFVVTAPFLLARKYSMFGLFWTMYSILKNYAEEA